MLKLIEIGHVVLKKKSFEGFSVSSLCGTYLPFGKDVTLQWNKIESSSQQTALCNVLLKLALGVLEKVVFTITGEELQC